MRRDLIFTEREARFLRELARNRVRFMIVGLSAAALQGAPVVTQDVDLWFRNPEDPRIRTVLKRVGGAYVPPIGLNPPAFAGEGVEMFDIVLTMHGLADFDSEWSHTVEVRLGRYRIKALSLDRIIRSKTVLNREKDRMVIRVLRDVLSTTRRKGRHGKESV